jgi:hypothetical protein
MAGRSHPPAMATAIMVLLLLLVSDCNYGHHANKLITIYYTHYTKPPNLQSVFITAQQAAGSCCLIILTTTTTTTVV